MKHFFHDFLVILKQALQNYTIIKLYYMDSDVVATIELELWKAPGLKLKLSWYESDVWLV